MKTKNNFSTTPPVIPIVIHLRTCQNRNLISRNINLLSYQSTFFAIRVASESRKISVAKLEMKFSVAFVIALAGYGESMPDTLLNIFQCFLSSAVATPFGEPIDPSFDAPRDVRFLIFTRSNRLVGHPVAMNDLASIDASPYDPSKPTRVVTHGWGGDETTDLVLGATHTLLLHHDFNILVIDWGVGAQTINYAAAVNRVRPTGEFCATYLDFLHQHGRLNFARIKLIGFSLGGECHILVAKSCF